MQRKPIFVPQVRRHFCKICDSEVPAPDWAQHEFSKKHRGKLEQHNLMASEPTIQNPPPPHVDMWPNHVWCAVCEVQVGLSPDVSLNLWLKHARGDKHQITTNRWISEGKLPADTPLYEEYAHGPLRVAKGNFFADIRREIEAEGVAQPPPPGVSLPAQHVWCQVCYQPVGLTNDRNFGEWRRHCASKAHQNFLRQAEDHRLQKHIDRSLTAKSPKSAPTLSREPEF